MLQPAPGQPLLPPLPPWPLAPALPPPLSAPALPAAPSGKLLPPPLAGPPPTSAPAWAAAPAPFALPPLVSATGGSRSIISDPQETATIEASAATSPAVRRLGAGDMARGRYHARQYPARHQGQQMPTNSRL